MRLLPFTGAIFLTAGLAGRLTGHVPTKLLIAPGFLLIGAGLVLMRGITPTDDWTHLLPGMVVAGVGCGLVNVPLASTAVGVVEPARAGMASGINSTFRQIGIATGVAALGSILASEVSSSVISKLAGSPLATGRTRSRRRSATAASCRRCTGWRRVCAASPAPPPRAASSTA